MFRIKTFFHQFSFVTQDKLTSFKKCTRPQQSVTRVKEFWRNTENLNCCCSSHEKLFVMFYYWLISGLISIWIISTIQKCNLLSYFLNSHSRIVLCYNERRWSKIFIHLPVNRFQKPTYCKTQVLGWRHLNCASNWTRMWIK